MLPVERPAAGAERTALEDWPFALYDKDRDDRVAVVQNIELETRYSRIIGTGGQLSKLTDDDYWLSKELSRVLRHKAEKMGLTIRPDGFVMFNGKFWRSMPKGATLRQVLKVVRLSDKSRFELMREEDQFLGSAVRRVIISSLWSLSSSSSRR